MSRATYIVGDVRDVLATLPDASVDLVLTSPPFLALRSYLPADHPDKGREIGSEPTPAEFLRTLLGLTDDLRRVLAPHGSIAIELGDTYSGTSETGWDRLGARASQPDQPPNYRKAGTRSDSGTLSHGRGWPRDKSLCFVPQLYGASLAYGRNLLDPTQTFAPWRVRNVVRWCRPNPPVGALGDKFRPATSEMTVACMARDRYFDLDAVRGPGSDNTHARTAKGVASRPSTGKTADDERRGGNFSTLDTLHETAGAPPLDWWEIPTEPYVTPSGVIVVPLGETSRRVRVPVGALGDGIQRTASPSCPVHGSPDRSGSSAPDGERAASATTRTGHTDAHPDQGRSDGSSPTPSTLGSSASTSATTHRECGPAATPHDTGSNRTDRALSTNPSGTPSARTTPRTDDTSATLWSSALDPDTPSSSSAAACPPAVEHGTPSRIADTSDPSSACTCSHWVEVSVASETSSHYASWPDDWWRIPTEGFAGAHYATWPTALLVRPILAMCPQRVCTVCGQPSRRITTTEQVPTRSTNGRKSYPERGSQCENFDQRTEARIETVGWTDCGHDAWRNGIVLDPLAGSGTTLSVATGHGRDAIGIDLDSRNLDLARERVGMFLDESVPL